MTEGTPVVTEGEALMFTVSSECGGGGSVDGARAEGRRRR